MKRLCRLLGVSRSGFYDYLRRQERDPDPEHEEKLEWVKDLAEASDHTYGSRRMAKALRALGWVDENQPKGTHLTTAIFSCFCSARADKKRRSGLRQFTHRHKPLDNRAPLCY